MAVRHRSATVHDAVAWARLSPQVCSMWFGIVMLAITIRLITFRGPIGSDDVVYLGRALDIANGVWSSADYNGALRYGYNIPSGMLLWTLGSTEFNANLISLVASIVEMVAVGWATARYVGSSAATYAMMMMAVSPIHVAVATSVHADPLAALAVTMSFISFWTAECRPSRLRYFLAGCGMGYVFWVKELLVVYLLGFAFYPVIFRRWSWLWAYVVAGLCLLVLFNMALIWYVAGDPLHGFRVYLGQIGRDFIGGTKEDGAAYYLYYMLYDIRHTTLLGFLALTSALIVSFRSVPAPAFIKFCLYWLGVMLLVLSVLPISLDPLKLVTKQSNYLNLFIAPLCILSGWLLTQMTCLGRGAILLCSFVGGMVLSFLGQADVMSLVGNSKALWQFASASERGVYYGSSTNANIATFYNLLRENEAIADVKPLSELRASGEPGLVRWAVIDPSTSRFRTSDNGPFEPLECWRFSQKIGPSSHSLGQEFAAALLRGIGFLPIAEYLPDEIQARLYGYAIPSGADIYMLPEKDGLCEKN